MGMAVHFLASLYRNPLRDVTIVGIGKPPDSVELLRAVDIPIVTASPYMPVLKRLVPNAQETHLSGSTGWSQAVLELLAVAESPSS
jgi:hypothetical protein